MTQQVAGLKEAGLTKCTRRQFIVGCCDLVQQPVTLPDTRMLFLNMIGHLLRVLETVTTDVTDKVRPGLV